MPFNQINNYLQIMVVRTIDLSNIIVKIIQHINHDCYHLSKGSRLQMWCNNSKSKNASTIISTIFAAITSSQKDQDLEIVKY